jgi:hypothetical protein
MMGLCPFDPNDHRPLTGSVCPLDLCPSNGSPDGFGGLVVSMLASGSRVRGFDPDRSRLIFSYVKKSSACLPSEGK